MKDDRKQFEEDKKKRIFEINKNKKLRGLSDQFLSEALSSGYPYNFSWFGVPLIQFPEDALMASEIVFNVKPKVIIDSGTARGGSAIFYASLLKLIGGHSVISIDIDIRPHNRDTVEKHPFGSMIKLVQGSSSDKNTFDKVKKLVGKRNPVVVALDSSHEESHVLRELELYSQLLSKGGYIMIFDTFIRKLPRSAYPADRPWDASHNPWTAIKKFLKTHKEFEVDELYNAKAMVSSAPMGFLKKVK